MAAAPAYALKPFTAQYDASFKGISAGGSMSLSQQGNRWTYSMGIRNAMANLSQATVFEEAAGRYRPLGGSDRSTYLMKTRAVVTLYNWKGMQARWTGDVKPDRAGPVKLVAGDMDALLVNLAIVRDVAAGKPLTYRMVENGRAKAMTYQVAGKERITVAGKPQDATKVVRTDGDKQTIVWVVADAPVPARILQREKGQDTIDLTLKSWR